MSKLIKYLIIISLLIVTGYLVVQIAITYKEKKEAEARVQTLPFAEFVSLEGVKINLHDFDHNKPLVIVYFHPECEYCLYEAEGIVQNGAAFNNCQLLLITADDSVRRVKQFCRNYNLWEMENLEVLLDRDGQFNKVFGKAMIPSVYIYGKNQKLIKRFYGETKPEVLISEIQKHK